MSSLKLYGSTSGYVEVAPEATAQNNSVTIPNTTGTIAVKDASGNLEVGTGVTIAAPSSNTYTVSTNGSERLRIDSSGNVGIGTDNPAAPLDVVSDSSAEIARLKGRSADNIGTLYFQNNAGSTNYAYIQSRPTYLDIATETTNPIIFTTNQSERMRLLSGGGLTFNGDTAAANALDDYEEGTFTPSFTGGTSGSGYTRQVGEYTKVGRLVTFTLTIDGDGGLTGTATAIEIGGLPFTSRNAPELGGAQYSYPGNFDTTNDRRFWLVAQNNTTLSYRSVTSANINGNLVTNINSQFVVYGHYYTDS